MGAAGGVESTCRVHRVRWTPLSWGYSHCNDRTRVGCADRLPLLERAGAASCTGPRRNKAVSSSSTKLSSVSQLYKALKSLPVHSRFPGSQAQGVLEGMTFLSAREGSCTQHK